MEWQGKKHLIGLRLTAKEDILNILDTARSFAQVLERPVKKVPSLRGITIVNLFFENSTRTRIAFELAQKRLSADVVNFSSAGSSLKKGESLLDTVRNIEAMKIDMIVVRHSATGVPEFLARNTGAIIVNAGDGANEHPTQGLLDMFTMRERLGDLQGKKVVIIGDVRHSRVARSNIWGLNKLGAHVVLCAPPTLLPGDLSGLPVTIEVDKYQACKNADVIMALRLQKERQDKALYPSEKEYRHFWGVTRGLLEQTSFKGIVMHPGPINRGWELDADVADDPKYSVILQQVTHGVAVRMAGLFILAGGEL
jgi:aspartate carbamoyltransferase catalytic subunit